MSKYKVIYKENVWNCICITPMIDVTRKENVTIGELEVVVLDETNRVKVLLDSGDNFQFIKRID
ncbi:MAG: hypothetical protein ACRC7N_21260 [Clostridium sp.]